MAIETYVNGSKNGCITFINDHEPCAVYVDGEKQTNISYTGESIQGSPSVKYASEYKKNLISMTVDGNTVQNGTPTPETPIPIHNAGDSGLTCILRGNNLFDRKDLTVILNNKYYSQFSANFELKPGTTYTIAFDYEFISIDNTTGTGWGMGRGTSSAYLADIVYSVKFPNFTKGRTSRTFTTPSNLGTYKYLHLRVPRNDTGVTCEVNLSNFMLNYGTMAEAYEPYIEPTNVEIPNEVSLINGIVPLLFAKLGDECETMIVDCKKKMVEYHQKIIKITLTGNENISSLDSKFGVNSYEITGPYFGLDKLAYCTHFSYYEGDFTKQNSFVITESMGLFNTPFTTVTEIATFLEEQYANGTPVEIVYATGYPNLYDIPTDVDSFTKELLNLPTQNQTNIIEITPSNIDNPNVSNISVTYAKWGGKTNEN